MNINDFINTVRGGFQHENRFLCLITTQTLMDNIRQARGLSQAEAAAGAAANTDIAGSGSGGGSTFRSAVDKFIPPLPDDMIFAGNALRTGMLCEATRLPSRSFETISQTMYGFAEKFPVQTEYIPLQCTFSMPLYCTQNPLVNGLENGVVNLALPDAFKLILKNPATNPLPKFFAAWQNLIQNGENGAESGYNFRFPKDYYTTVQIITFDKQDTATLVYTFENVYPVTVESSEVAWYADNFARLNVTFAYSYWKLSTPPASGIKLNFSGIPIVRGGSITL